MAQLVCPERAIQQITDGDRESRNPSINADGKLIAFQSNTNLTGGNPDESREIYLFDSITEIITQITDATGGLSSDPSINAPGTLIAFHSNRNLTGGNPLLLNQIFLANTVTGTITQITNVTADGARSASINGDGTRIAFQSDADINGGNPDGNQEIYLADVSSGTIIQITDTMGGNNTDSSINADGTRIAFESNRNITGGNPLLLEQIFLAYTTTGTFTQITNITSDSVFAASIDGDGTLIAFWSNANINGGNPDGNTEIYLADTIAGIITQITNTTTVNNRDPSISKDGLRIAFESSANLSGGEPRWKR